MNCLSDVKRRISILLLQIICFPLLEKVSITDSGKSGEVSLRAGAISKVRSGVLSTKTTIEEWVTRSLLFSSRMSHCYIPLLELPVSGYVMKGVTLYVVGRDDLPSFTNFDLDDDFEDKEEAAAYREAVTEIMKNHRGRWWRRSGTEFSI